MRLLPDLKSSFSPAILRPALTWLAAQAALQKPQLFLWMPVLLAIGIGGYFALPAQPPFIVGLLSAGILFAALFLLFPVRERSAVFYSAWLALLACSLVATGFLAASYRTQDAYTPMLEKELAPVGVQGVITDIEDLGDGEGSRLILSNVYIERLSKSETPHKIRVKVREKEGLEMGQEISVLAGLNAPSGPSIPGSFDFRRYSYFQGIGAMGFAYKAPEVLRESTSRGIGTLIDELRYNIGQRIEAATNYPEAGVITALITGKRTAISDEDFEAIRNSGLAHMLAISGLHVGLFSATFFFFARLIMAAIPGFALNHPIKKYAAITGIAAAFFYMLIAGATIPAQRAMLMSGIVFLAVIFDRSPLSLRLVAFAAFMVLLFSPESLISVSFQMSFAAVIGLVVFFNSIREWWSKFHATASITRRFALYFLGITLTTVIASAATAPFALFHFQKLAMYSNLSNFFAVPILAFIIMPFAILSLLLMPLGLESLPLTAVSWGVGAMLDIAHWTADMDGAVWRVTQWPSIALLGMAGGGIAMMLIKGPLKMVALLPLVLALIGIAQYRPPDIVIAANHKLMAYAPVEKSLSVSSTRRESFTRENWEQLYGLEEGQASAWPREGMTANGMACDELGCRLHHGAYKIAFSHSALSYVEDCAWADILISKYPVEKRQCGARMIIDKFDTWRHGAHGIWLDDKPSIKRVNDSRGQWPWTTSKPQ